MIATLVAGAGAKLGILPYLHGQHPDPNSALLETKERPGSRCVGFLAMGKPPICLGNYGDRGCIFSRWSLVSRLKPVKPVPHLLVGVDVRRSEAGHVRDANGARVEPPIGQRFQYLADLLVLACSIRTGAQQ